MASRALFSGPLGVQVQCETQTVCVSVLRLIAWPRSRPNTPLGFRHWHLSEDQLGLLTRCGVQRAPNAARMSSLSNSSILRESHPSRVPCAVEWTLSASNNAHPRVRSSLWCHSCHDVIPHARDAAIHRLMLSRLQFVSINLVRISWHQRLLRRIVVPVILVCSSANGDQPDSADPWHCYVATQTGVCNIP